MPQERQLILHHQLQSYVLPYASFRAILASLDPHALHAADPAPLLAEQHNMYDCILVMTEVPTYHRWTGNIRFDTGVEGQGPRRVEHTFARWSYQEFRAVLLYLYLYAHGSSLLSYHERASLVSPKHVYSSPVIHLPPRLLSPLHQTHYQECTASSQSVLFLPILGRLPGNNGDDRSQLCATNSSIHTNWLTTSRIWTPFSLSKAAIAWAFSPPLLPTMRQERIGVTANINIRT